MIKLERAYLDNMTFGKIYYAGEFICYSLERPWLNNIKNESCIPAGIYKIEKYNSSKFPDCFSLLSYDLGVGLTDRFHRTNILIHPANFVRELNGCIAPGLELRSDTWGVGRSRDALSRLRALIDMKQVEQIQIK